MFLSKFGLASEKVNRLDGIELHVDVTQPFVEVINGVMEVTALNQCDMQLRLPGIGKCRDMFKASRHRL